MNKADVTIDGNAIISQSAPDNPDWTIPYGKGYSVIRGLGCHGILTLLDLFLPILFTNYGLYADYRDRSSSKLNVISASNYFPELTSLTCTLTTWVATSIADQGT